MEINGTRDETPKVLFERTTNELKGKEHESCPRCTFVDKTRIAENGTGRIACHGGICYRRLDGVLIVGLEKTLTVIKRNLCTIWGLWEAHEGVERTVGEYGY